MKKDAWSKVLYIGLFCIGGITLHFFAYSSFPLQERTVTNQIALYGVYVSFAGFIYTLMQVSSIKKISEVTKEEVVLTKKRLTQILTVSDLAKGIQISREVQSQLNLGKYDMGLLRMQDLKSIIIQAKHINHLNIVTSSSEYREIVAKVSTDLVNLASFIRNNKRRIDLEIIYKNLERVSTYLITMESELKTKDHDTE